jgi:hypothetical protein
MGVIISRENNSREKISAQDEDRDLVHMGTKKILFLRFKKFWK